MNLDWIKAYKIVELEKLENLNFRTIKSRKHRYIPIIIENWLTRAWFKMGNKSKPYSIMYIRVKDINDYLKMIEKTNSK